MHSGRRLEQVAGVAAIPVLHAASGQDASPLKSPATDTDVPSTSAAFRRITTLPSSMRGDANAGVRHFL